MIPRISTLDRRETLCKNILSDNKELRNKSREKLINYINAKKMPILDADQKENYPNYALVSIAIKKFMKDKFIFEMKDEAGSILEKGKEQNYGKHSSLDKDSNEPTYIVTMPHLAGNGRLEGQIKLLFEEGFSTTSEESIEEAKKRLHLIVGVNFCYDIDPAKNKAKKKYIQDLFKKNLGKNVSIEAFRWSPNWAYSYNVPSGAPSSSQSVVKRVFRLLKDLDSDKASKVYKKVMIKKKVPYQAIRQEILKSESFNAYFTKFRALRDDRPCYLFTFDDDAVALRTAKIGLFSQYDRLIRLNPDLEAATTGYYMIDPDNIYVEIGSKSNLVSRIATAYSRANAGYIPEPNGLWKIKNGKTLDRNLSFVKKNDKTGIMESIRMLENLGLMKGDQQGRIVWGSLGPIHTAKSPNVEIPKHLQNIEIASAFKDSENLDSLRVFSQSSLNPLNGFAAGMMRTFPTGYNKGAYKGPLAYIYTAFDPIEYAKYLPKAWLKVYSTVHHIIFRVSNRNNEKKNKILSDPKKFEKSFTRIAEKIANEFALKNVEPIAKLISEKSVSLLTAVDTLKKAKNANKKHLFTSGQIEMMVQTSRNTNMNVYNYLRSQIKGEPFKFKTL